jgi:hypothetical protein
MVWDPSLEGLHNFQGDWVGKIKDKTSVMLQQMRARGEQMAVSTTYEYL